MVFLIKDLYWMFGLFFVLLLFFRSFNDDTYVSEWWFNIACLFGFFIMLGVSATLGIAIVTWLLILCGVVK